MNKILRIVGYVVLLLALAGTTVLFMQKNKSYKQTASFAEDAAKLMEENQSVIDTNNAKIAELRNQMKYTVQSPMLPLYLGACDAAALQLKQGDVLYVYSIDKNTGMARVVVDNDSENIQYETYADLIISEIGGEYNGPVVVSMEAVEQADLYEVSATVMEQFVSALKKANIVVLWPRTQESVSRNWNQIASECGADAHIVIRVGAQPGEHPMCSIVASDDADRSLALKNLIETLLPEDLRPEAEVTEDDSEAATEETASVEPEMVKEPATDEVALDITDANSTEETDKTEGLLEGLASVITDSIDAGDSATEKQTVVQVSPATCTITFSIITVASEGEGAEAEDTDTENADAEEVPDEDIDPISRMINSILLGINSYLGSNK